MPIKQVDPLEAADLLKNHREAVYLDVRTEDEFAAGYPAGALNVPFMFLIPGNPQQNPDFLTVVGKLLQKDQKIIVGCRSGARSQRACEELEQAGYTDLTNVRGGYGGARDASGNIAVKGWEDSHLPISHDLSENSYQALRSKAGL
jgi:rhodanese-related sulfurtransferase